MNRLNQLRTILLVWAAFLTLVPFKSPQAQRHPDPKLADLVLHNGVIWTVDSKNSTAQAVAIRDGKFMVVGSNEAALKLRGPKTQIIDLQGNFVTPGFNDNHVHFASAAQFLEFNIMAVSTQEEFVARVREVIARLPKGEWIVGGFWGAYDEWAAGSAGGHQARALRSQYETGRRDNGRLPNVHSEV